MINKVINNYGVYIYGKLYSLSSVLVLKRKESA